jgi:two-component system sensor histidine kinase VicK
MPDSLPELIADRTALTQVITSLLENASKVSSEGERITLRVEVKGEREEQVYVLLQVTDQGGGVQPQDLTHVFSRLYRAPIPGVGDTGAGLSIVKTLVEALHGRIWVDSEPGLGATFSVLLPISALETQIDETGESWL